MSMNRFTAALIVIVLAAVFAVAFRPGTSSAAAMGDDLVPQHLVPDVTAIVAGPLAQQTEVTAQHVPVAEITARENAQPEPDLAEPVIRLKQAAIAPSLVTHVAKEPAAAPAPVEARLEREPQQLIAELSLRQAPASSSGSAATQQKAAHRFKLATLAPTGSSLEKLLQRMGQEWRKAPGGGVELVIYAGGVQGGEADTVRKLRQGSLDAALLTVVGLSEIHDSVEALQNMPMMFRSLEEVDYVGDKLRPRIEKNLRDKGYVVLFWADLGWVRFFSKEPILTPADLKKAKLFSWAGSIDGADILKAAGFAPVPLETADILPSLNTGLINAVALPPYYALATQVHRSAPNMLEINWAPLVGGMVVRERSWNKLSPDTQRELARAAWQAGERMRSQNRAESDRAAQAMAAAGLRVHKLTPAQEAEWRQTARAAYPMIRGRIVPADLFDEVEKHLNEYREQQRGGASPRP
jgi:TRAP-type transport system periplasmic protein